MQCSVCKTNPAIIFANKIDEHGKNTLEGFCYSCAKQKGINPLEVLAKQTAGMEGADMEELTSQFENMLKDITRKYEYRRTKYRWCFW